jgi:hypothetical protein
VVLLPAEPPLVPAPDDARSRLRRELLDPAYHQQDLLQRLLTWVDRRLSGLLDATSRAPEVSTVVAMVVLVALALGLGLLVSRVRRHARAESTDRAVLTGEAVTARELRERAEAALAAGRHEEAVVEGFRALTLRQVERGRLPDTPGATSHEVARALAGEHPEHAVRIDHVALLFDRVLYGEHRTDRDAAAGVLGLDDALTERRRVAPR